LPTFGKPRSGNCHISFAHLSSERTWSLIRKRYSSSANREIRRKLSKPSSCRVTLAKSGILLLSEDQLSSPSFFGPKQEERALIQGKRLAEIWVKGKRQGRKEKEKR